MELLSLLGITSAVLFLVGDWFYIKDTIWGQGRPHRIAFGIFLLINIVNVFNQLAIGASASLWLFLSATVTTLAIFVLSWFKGVGGSEPLDWFVLAGCLVGVGLWVVSREPMVSVWANFGVAILSVVPVFKKSYLRPYEEPIIPWIVCGIASLIGSAAVGRLDFALLLLPLQGAVLQLGVFWVIRTRRAQMKPPATPALSASDIPATI